MNDDLKRILQIRYVKLHYTIRFTKTCDVPKSKTSALRGGMGEMMLRANCIRDRKCESCDFESECIVQRTMYSRLEKTPAYMSDKDSVGYVIECEDYKESVIEGDTLKFNLILFGKTICYLNQYMNALYALGQNGLGKECATFAIVGVTNTDGIPILENGNIYMERYKVKTLQEYVEYRHQQLKKPTNMIKFKTATTIKYNGSIIDEFNMDAVIKSLKRRLYILNCFEGIDGEDYFNREFETPKMVNQEVHRVEMKRFSSRQNSKMSLYGIKGTIEIADVYDEILDLLFAGEITHIGKNTSFGFGRYKLGNTEEATRL